MKHSIITEFVTFKKLETTPDEQLISVAERNVTGFHMKQEGFIDAELVKDVEENEWCFIFHYESLEQIMAVGEKMRKSREFGEFIPLIVPQSIHATFNDHLRRWR
jgi:hypothetical protein